MEFELYTRLTLPPVEIHTIHLDGLPVRVVIDPTLPPNTIRIGPYTWTGMKDEGEA